MILRILFLSAVVLVSTSLFNNAYSQGISVDQGRLFFKGLPGEAQTQEVVISNPTQTKVLIQMSLSDWKRDETGAKNYFEANALENSCASWLSLSTTSLEIPPMSEKTLQIQMTPPADFSPDQSVQNTMLFVRQISDPYARTETGSNLKSSMSVAFQIGIHVYYIHPSLQRKEVAIRGFKFEKTSDQSLANQLMLRLENVGETVLDSSIKIELTHESTGKEYRLFDKQPVAAAFMPKDVRNIPMEIPTDLPAGNYSALAIVDIGPAHSLQMAVIDIELPQGDD